MGLERARRAQAGSGQRLASVLSGRGLATERDITDGFAALFDIPIVKRADYPAAPIKSRGLRAPGESVEYDLGV